MRGTTFAIVSALIFLPLLLSSCGGGGSVSENRSNRGYDPGVGPFDSRGNYIERWADDKSKGGKWRRSKSTKIAKTKPPKKPKRAKNKTTTPAFTPPPVIASNVTPAPRPVASRATAYPTPRPAPPVSSQATSPRSTARPATRPTTVAASPTSPRVTPKPRPRPTTSVKVAPKRKAPISHTVVKGDTLYGLSRKYKTSVTAIQRANGLKGTNLRIGRKLLIPRY